MMLFGPAVRGPSAAPSLVGDVFGRAGFPRFTFICLDTGRFVLSNRREIASVPSKSRESKSLVKLYSSALTPPGTYPIPQSMGFRAWLLAAAAVAGFLWPETPSPPALSKALDSMLCRNFTGVMGGAICCCWFERREE